MLCYVQAPLVPQTIPQTNLYIQIPTWKEGFFGSILLCSPTLAIINK
jgi:hypothetical protein